jgi:hypothetical protein
MLDDAVHRGQPESGAAPYLFAGEEGLVDARHDRF